MNKELAEKLESLKEYFENRQDVEMAFLFGSRAKGQETSESDADIAVYFKPKSGQLEWEDETEYENESKIWSDIEKILGINTDFIVLNRAPSTLADSIIREGEPIIIKNKKLYFDFFLRATSTAADFREFVKDFWKIKERSQSLSPQDKERLTRIVDFLKTELKDIDKFKDLDQKTYERNTDVRRSAERWAENIVNASIDIAKILLASNKAKIPQTYKEVIQKLPLVLDFDEKSASGIAEFTKLRNVLAHEYLDMRFNQIKKFIDTMEMPYEYLVDYTIKILQK